MADTHTEDASSAERVEEEGIRGWLHRPVGEARAALGLTHGAGSNCGTALLVAVAEALAGLGYAVLRYDLPYRQQRPAGPPMRSAAMDQAGVALVARWLKQRLPGAVYLGGHSYGGRMTSMAAAADGTLCDALLLLSYPLHPPKQAAKLRTEHFPALKTPALFVSGTRDEFGSIAELQAAIAAIPARTRVQPVTGGHGLDKKYAPEIAEWFAGFVQEC